MTSDDDTDTISDSIETVVKRFGTPQPKLDSAGSGSVHETFYSQIATTILDRGPMCVSEIYKALIEQGCCSSTKNSKQSNWKNSVRHALSYKKYFIKSKKEGGNKRGSLWNVDYELFVYEQASKKARKRIKTTIEVVETTRKRNQKFLEFAIPVEKMLVRHFQLERLDDCPDNFNDDNDTDNLIAVKYADI